MIFHGICPRHSCHSKLPTFSAHSSHSRQDRGRRSWDLPPPPIMRSPATRHQHAPQRIRASGFGPFAHERRSRTQNRTRRLWRHEHRHGLARRSMAQMRTDASTFPSIAELDRAVASPAGYKTKSNPAATAHIKRILWAGTEHGKSFSLNAPELARSSRAQILFSQQYRPQTKRAANLAVKKPHDSWNKIPRGAARTLLHRKPRAIGIGNGVEITRGIVKTQRVPFSRDWIGHSSTESAVPHFTNHAVQGQASASPIQAFEEPEASLESQEFPSQN